MTALLALLMALNAFAIDAMIPALPQIGADLGVEEDNQRQLVVVAYFLGFGATQLVWGPLADRFGRKPILAIGSRSTRVRLAVRLATIPAADRGRIAMGASAAVTRVLVISMIRDLFAGESMDRIMSLVFMVFMLVPVLAPSIGQAILLLFPWRAIFIVLALYAVAMLAWSWVRLPETLHPEFRRSLKLSEMGRAMLDTVRERQSIGYTLALTVSFAGLVAYIASVQQIVFDVFKAPELIGVAFAAIAAPMAVASYANSRIVERFGLRRVGHASTSRSWCDRGPSRFRAGGLETFALFIFMQGLTMAASPHLIEFRNPAMEHMAPIAGTASSVQGVIGTLGSAAIGFAIGQAYDGTIIPYLGGIAACAVAGMLIVVLTEPGKLFAALPVESADPTPCMPDDLC